MRIGSLASQRIERALVRLKAGGRFLPKSLLGESIDYALGQWASPAGVPPCIPEEDGDRVEARAGLAKVPTRYGDRVEARAGLANVPANCVQRRVRARGLRVSAATPWGWKVFDSPTQRSPEDRGNVGLWDAAPRPGMEVFSGALGMIPIPGWALS